MLYHLYMLISKDCTAREEVRAKLVLVGYICPSKCVQKRGNAK